VTDHQSALDHHMDPAIMSGPLLLADLTSPEIAAIADDIEIVLIPIGAHEQHGGALPVSTDALTAQVLCSLASTLMRPRVAVAPVVPWGVSWQHTGKTGTISLREQTLIDIVLDIVRSLAGDGHRRILLVNTHGGNNAALAIAAARAHRELGVPFVAPVYAYSLLADAAREVLGEEAIGHGGGDEAAAVLAIRPDLVRPELFANPEINVELRHLSQLLQAAGGVLPVMQHLVTPSGATGDSRAATGEAGNVILGKAVAQLQGIIEHILAIDPPLAPTGIARPTSS
jgi:creatinine amidohydrolase